MKIRTMMLTVVTSVALCGMLVVSPVVHAETDPKTTTPTASQNTKTPTPAGSSATAPDFNLAVKFQNPLKVDTIQEAIALLVRTIIKLAIPVIVIFFIWSGLSFILAMGNPKKVGDAKNMFFYTVIGTLLILGAWTITNVIVGTVNSVAN